VSPRRLRPPHFVDRPTRRLLLIRLIILLTTLAGLRYLSWRWSSSLNWSQWYVSIPLVVAETYTMIDGLLFGLTMWRSTPRPPPPRAERGQSVDVLITTYNEPIDLVMNTASAALLIRYPHQTYVLDDGNRLEMRERAIAAGIGYINRSEDWVNRPLHAKAGNLNNALMSTSGEFILILDADMVPRPEILDETLGYFQDPRVGLVQTPQIFVNVPDNDPLGSQATLFYGPIMQGKDGWNSAFFCGSNAVLRREALMQLAITGYVRDVDRVLHQTLVSARRVVARSRRRLEDLPSAQAALATIERAVLDAKHDLRAKEPFEEVVLRFQNSVKSAARSVVLSDLEQMQRDLAEIGESTEVHNAEMREERLLITLAHGQQSPLRALESLSAMVDALDVDRGHDAQPLMPLATISITEDMATAMRLHALGWRSVFHLKPLADGLAPEDLGSSMQQRLRWAQGTLQVMFRENPLVQHGLSISQRLMYFATMWSYLSGFANLVFVAAPVTYLLFNWRPVKSFGGPFLTHLLPYLIINQLLFIIVGFRHRTFRGQQYSFAMFPLWIRAFRTTVANVIFGRPLGFVVTPKVRAESSFAQNMRIVWPQLLTMGLLFVSMVVGFVHLATHTAPSVEGTWLNVVWILIDLIMIGVIFKAAAYRGFEEPAT
jgi:cellulose synthase (UDP-forming)